MGFVLSNSSCYWQYWCHCQWRRKFETDDYYAKRNSQPDTQSYSRNYMSTPRFRSNEKFFWRPTRSTATDVTNFLIRPTRLPQSKTVKNFFLMRPMKRDNENQDGKSTTENQKLHRYLRNNVQKPFWLRPTRATMK